jgi:hypothetical protein
MIACQQPEARLTLKIPHAVTTLTASATTALIVPEKD